MIQKYAPAVALAVITVVFAALNISLVIEAGALSAPPIYDDNGYLLDAYQRLAFDGVNSIWSLIGNFLQAPPHSPVETLTALAGYSIFDRGNEGPYIAKVWVLAAYAAIMLKVARDRLSPWTSLAVVTVMLFVPAAGAIMGELRPDLTAGLFFGFAGYLLILKPIEGRSIAWTLALGVFCALACVIKLSAVVITVPMLGAAYLLSSGLSWRIDLKRAIALSAGALSVLVPVALIWGPQTYTYVWNALVTNKDIWYTAGGWGYHLAYSAFGDGGGRALGPFFWSGALLIAADIVISMARPREPFARAGAYYIWCGIIFLGIASAADKSIYQSSFFFFPFLIASVIAAGRLLGRLPSRWEAAPVLGALAACLAFLPAANTYQLNQHRAYTRPMLEQISPIIAEASAAVPACNGEIHAISVVGSYPITAEAVALDVAQRFRTRTTIYHLFIMRSYEEMMGFIDRSNFVVFPNEEGMKEAVNQHLPGVQFSDQIREALSRDDRWEGRSIEAADPLMVFTRKAC